LEFRSNTHINHRILDWQVPTPMFTALSFNMQNGEVWGGAEGSCDLAATAAFVMSVDVDVVLLQEVEEGRDGGGQVLPPPNFRTLQTMLPGYDGVFAYPPDNPDELPFGIGLAIFSRFPLHDFWKQELPAAVALFDFGGRMRRPSRRMLIGATAEVEGTPVALLNTHLQAYFMIGLRADDQPAQRDIVLSRMRGAGRHALLGGDFNCAPEDELVAAFQDKGFQPAQTTVPTWKRRPYVVDHLFNAPGLRLVEAAVVPTTASDHDAVLGRYEILG
jgi:endonuclease/exonuclease/phosphatase family metal-dependent hydrolase